MRPADEFVELYNQAADYLGQKIGENTWSSFYQLIDRAETAQLLSRPDARRLRRYGDLRNPIVHDPRYPSQVIAEPTPETIAEFAAILQRIIAPRRLSSFRRQLQLFSKADKLAAALSYMREHDYSQVLVRDNSALALLTAEGITKWLEEQIEQDIISLADATIGDALVWESTTNFKVMGLSATVDMAQDAFASAVELGNPQLIAIVITQNGRLHEAPLGIITPWDIIEVSN